MKHILGTTLLSLAALTACTPNVGHQAASPKPPAGVEEVLPSNIAGAPQHIEIPHQQNPPVIKAVAHGGKVRIESRSRWHGKVVTLYYLPASNVIHMGDHYELKSARTVQYLTRTTVKADGTWYALWNSGQYGVPRHRPFFIMARDDLGEIGIAQINTVN